MLKTIISLVILFIFIEYFDLFSDSDSKSKIFGFFAALLILSALMEIDVDVPEFTRLWFDWIKWLILAGALTIVAQKTQDQLLIILKDTTYFILFAYLGVSLLNASFKMSDYIEEKLNSGDVSWFSPQLKEDLAFIISMCLFTLVLFTIVKISQDWNALLENIVTKLPIKE